MYDIMGRLVEQRWMGVRKQEGWCNGSSGGNVDIEEEKQDMLGMDRAQ
jgi:hypothetical protein